MHRSSLPSRVDDSGQSKHESNGNSSDRFHQCVSCLIWKVVGGPVLTNRLLPSRTDAKSEAHRVAGKSHRDSTVKEDQLLVQQVCH
jgi:hypothetical protein